MEPRFIFEERLILIDNLISFDLYKKEDKHLFELSLTELECEYRHLLHQSHPHSGIEAIKLNRRKKNQCGR
jgi:Fur-regulated basic protein A